MYGIYGNIYHQYTPNVSIYTSTMDPMGDGARFNRFTGPQLLVIAVFKSPVFHPTLGIQA